MSEYGDISFIKQVALRSLLGVMIWSAKQVISIVRWRVIAIQWMALLKTNL